MQGHQDQRIPTVISQHPIVFEILLANQENNKGVGGCYQVVKIWIAHSVHCNIGKGEVFRINPIQHSCPAGKHCTDKQDPIFLCPVYAPEQGFLPEYDKGEFDICGTKMFLSTGLEGYYLVPRIFNRVEILKITIN